MNEFFDDGLSLTRETAILVIILVIALSLMYVFGHFFKLAKGLNKKYFEARWVEILALVSDKKTITLAVIEADKLVDQALLKKGYLGKTMGERLVSAGHDIKDQDGMWRAHKLRNRIVHEVNFRVKQAEVKSALHGIRQALKDLGAIR